MAVVLSGARPVPATTSAEFVRLAPDGAGALNVVSAIIVDFRALDTVGEITVLFTAAMGVASLVLDRPYERLRRRRDGAAGDDARAAEGPGQEEDVALTTAVDDGLGHGAGLGAGDGAGDGAVTDSGVWRPAPLPVEGGERS
jgi:hypothetical protein